MDTPIRDAKRALRQEVLARLKNLTAARRVEAGAQARALLIQQPVWKAAQSVLFFAPMPEELDVWPLLAEALGADKTAALPRFVPQTKSYIACPILDPHLDVSPGYYGIREPVERCARAPLNRLDLILVPGVAFDLHGRRLGRGKGFYDQLLAAVRGTRCGVAFDEQIVPQLPVEPHDVALDCIVTPTRWLAL